MYSRGHTRLNRINFVHSPRAVIIIVESHDLDHMSSIKDRNIIRRVRDFRDRTPKAVGTMVGESDLSISNTECSENLEKRSETVDWGRLGIA